MPAMFPMWLMSCSMVTGLPRSSSHCCMNFISSLCEMLIRLPNASSSLLRVREGIISRRGRDIPLTRISDLSFTRSLLDRLVGAGRLVVESAGEHGQIVLTDIPQVERVQAILFELVEEQQHGAGPAGRPQDDL